MEQNTSYYDGYSENIVEEEMPLQKDNQSNQYTNMSFEYL
eukprot:CAMPEP_0170555764 /NCGR_PEP_ID=MMETSP0211-20121228/13594_1 /TAXON_ID=311385 /ORGANISM="Pseudokeronopsis sp., Strain OXSARD2" /LENGTH=39 /DNA_ID= /DNA_START= /DNA_END= /DNA_ORIENTATION=